jgi:hypothetical protein
MKIRWTQINQIGLSAQLCPSDLHLWQKFFLRITAANRGKTAIDYEAS